MNKRRVGQRALTFVLALAMIAGIVPFTAMADENTIASFDVPETQISVAVNTALTDIGLPTTLSATMEDGSKVDIPVTWDGGDLYDGTTDGIFTFRAVLASGYTYGGATPTAVVTVVAPAALLTLTGAQLNPEGKAIALVNEGTGIAEYYDTLAAAFEAMTEAVEYSVVICADYSYAATDAAAVQAATSATKINISSIYNDGVKDVVSKFTLPSSQNWLCSTVTEFRDIDFVNDGVNNIIARGNELTMGGNITMSTDYMSVYGGSNIAYSGDSDVTVLSGQYANVFGGNYSGTMTGNAKATVGGNAAVTNLFGGGATAMGDNSSTTLNIDGTNGAKVSKVYAAGSASNATLPATAKMTINVKNTQGITLLDASTRNSANENIINIEGEVGVNGLTASTATLAMAANSHLFFTGSADKTIKDIDVQGTEALVDIYKATSTKSLTVNGEYKNTENKLMLGVCGTAAAAGDKLLYFPTPANAIAEHYQGNAITVRKEEKYIVVDAAEPRLIVENYFAGKGLVVSSVYDDATKTYTVTFTKSAAAQDQDICVVVNNLYTDLSKNNWSCSARGDVVGGTVQRDADGKVKSITVQISASADNVVQMGVYLGTQTQSGGQDDDLRNSDIENAYRPTGEVTKENDMEAPRQGNYQKTATNSAYLYKTAEWTDKENGQARITLTGLDVGSGNERFDGVPLYIFQVCTAHKLTKKIVSVNINFLINAYGPVNLIAINNQDINSGILYDYAATDDSILSECKFDGGIHFLESQMMALHNVLFDENGKQQYFPSAIYVSSDSIPMAKDASQLDGSYKTDTELIAKGHRLMTLLKEYDARGRYFYISSPDVIKDISSGNNDLALFLPAFVLPSVYTDPYSLPAVSTDKTYDTGFDEMEHILVEKSMEIEDVISDKYAINDITAQNGLQATIAGQSITAEGKVVAGQPAQVVVDVTLKDLTEVNNWIATNYGKATLTCSSGTPLAVDSPELALYEEMPNAPLTVSKTVTTPEGVTAPEDNEFTFTIKAGSPLTACASQPYKLYNSSNNEEISGTYATDGEGKFTLKAGQYAVFEGLEIGTAYEVTETPKANYTQTAPVQDGTPIAASGNIVAGGSTAAFTNSYAPPTLTISKTVAGTYGSKELSFYFNVTIKNADGTGYTGADVSYKIGSAGAVTPMTFDEHGKSASTIPLKHGESAVLTGIPADATVTIKEMAVKDYVTTYKIDDATTDTQHWPIEGLTEPEPVAIPAMTTSHTIAFTNTNDTPPAAGVTIRKYVIGEYGDTARDFTFQITATAPVNGEDTPLAGPLHYYLESDTAETPTEHTLTLDNGVGTVELAHGEGIVITDMPSNGKITVTEQNVPEVYTTYLSVDERERALDDDRSTGEVPLDGAETKRFYFYNEYGLVETGIRLGGSGGNGGRILLLVVTSLLLVLTLTGLVMVLRKRRPSRRARH